MKLPRIWLCYFSEKLCYYSVIRSMEVRWIVNPWCIEKVVLWDRNIAVFGKRERSVPVFLPLVQCAMCGVWVCALPCFFSQVSVYSDPPSQQKEHKWVLGSSISVFYLGLPLDILVSETYSNLARQRRCIFVFLYSLFLFLWQVLDLFSLVLPILLYSHVEVIYCGKSCLRLFGEKQ